MKMIVRFGRIQSSLSGDRENIIFAISAFSINC